MISPRSLIKKVKEKSICIGIHYLISLHFQPLYKYLGYKKGDFSKLEKFAEEILILPTYPKLTEGQTKLIISSIKILYD